MKLHENAQLYSEAITSTAQQKGLPEIYIEKDYWITLALYTIFHSDIGQETVFKGGTSLSKCYNCIERFSEDIDLVVLRFEGEPENKLKMKLKKISETVNKSIPETSIEGITHKMGMIRKTAHSYHKSFHGQFQQVRDTIIIESTWLGSVEPYSKCSLTSYISEMMHVNGRDDLIHRYRLDPFEVNVLGINRTLCEKIMSLVRFSHALNPYKSLNNKIRHIYDLYKLLQIEEVYTFFYSDNFEKLLISIAHEDSMSFKNNNSWLAHHPAKAIVYSDVKNVWLRLRQTYLSAFKELVYGKFPEESSMTVTLEKIGERLLDINWRLT